MDEAQLDKILVASVPAQRKGLKIEDWTKLVEALAIIIGGVWVVYMFLDHEREFHRYTAQTLELETKLKGLALDAANQSPLKVDVDLDVERLPTHDGELQDFEAHLKVEVKNPSLHPIDITDSEVQLYLGDMHVPNTGEFALLTNKPKEKEASDASEPDGPISWKLSKKFHYVSASEVSRRRGESSDYKLPQDMSLGAPAFGVLLHEEAGDSRTIYRIRSRPDRWIGFIIKFKLDNEWAWVGDEFDYLGSAEERKPSKVNTGESPRPTAMKEAQH